MNKKPLGLILIHLTAILSGLVTACSKTNTLMPNQAVPPTGSAVTKKISPEEAKELLAEENPPKLIDVREPSEFESGHIPGAINVPAGDLVRGIESLGIAKDAPLIVYCRSGARSGQASKMLNAAGFTHVLDLGGIINWPYEIQ